MNSSYTKGNHLENLFWKLHFYSLPILILFSYFIGTTNAKNTKEFLNQQQKESRESNHSFQFFFFLSQSWFTGGSHQQCIYILDKTSFCQTSTEALSLYSMSFASLLCFRIFPTQIRYYIAMEILPFQDPFQFYLRLDQRKRCGSIWNLWPFQC